MKRMEKNVESMDKVKGAKCMHDYHPSKPPRAAHEALYRLVLEVVARLENRRMHFFHRIAKLDAEPGQNIALPCVVLGVHARLNLLIIHDAHAKFLLRLCRVERRSCTLDLRQKLLPKCERVPQSVEHVFCL
jgi:hypothetical protein